MNFELIEKNNELLKKLSEGNKKYCQKLLSYIRTAGLFYDEEEVENLLSQILQDIILAEENDESADDYFGERPQEVADELIKNLGKASLKKSFKKVGGLLGGSLIMVLLVSLSSPLLGINIISLILFSLLGFLVVALFYLFIHKGVYKNLGDNLMVTFLFGVVFAFLVIGLALAIFFLVPYLIPSSTIPISNPVGIFLISVLLIVNIFLALRNKDKINVQLPLLPMVWILGGLGIIQRIPQAESWLDNHEIFIIVLLIFGFAFSQLFTILALLKEKKRQEKIGGLRE